MGNSCDCCCDLDKSGGGGGKGSCDTTGHRGCWIPGCFRCLEREKVIKGRFKTAGVFIIGSAYLVDDEDGGGRGAVDRGGGGSNNNTSNTVQSM